MSCNICLAPILVAERFLNPARMDRVTQEDHLSPVVNQVCPAKEHQPYFRDVTWLDYKFEGIVGYDTVHAGRGVFISRNWIHLDGGMPTAIYQEETEGQVTANVMHTGCLKLYCEQIGVPFDLSADGGRETLVALVERHQMMGVTKFGGYEGIDYSEGRLDERWETQPTGDEKNGNIFKWKFEDGRYDWTMIRPNVFPRLHDPEVYSKLKPERLGLCANPAPANDLLSTSPDLVFLNIATHLSISDLYNISILNKTLRHRCITTSSYQNLVRDQLKGTFALAVPAEILPHYPSGFPFPTASGDWLLYGYHVHKTSSMRNRRRIFNLISQLKHRYLIKAEAEGYLSDPQSEQKRKYVRTIVDQQLLLRRLNAMYDFELLVKVLGELNKAVSADLMKAKFMGTKLPQAMEKVMGMVEGKKGRGNQRPTQATEKKIMAKIDERMMLVKLEKERYRQRRLPGGPQDRDI